MHRLRASFLLLSTFTLWVLSAFLHLEIPFTDITLWGWHFYLIATVMCHTPNVVVKRSGLAFWMWTDQGVNVFHGGDEDVTISSKVGERKKLGSKTAAAMAAVIDALWYLGTGEKNHCIKAIEHDEEHH